MKLTDLINDPEKLMAMSDEELHKCLSPYYTVTRPDESKRKAAETKPSTSNPMAKRLPSVSKKAKIDNLEHKLKLLGI